MVSLPSILMADFSIKAELKKSFKKARDKELSIDERYLAYRSFFNDARGFLDENSGINEKIDKIEYRRFNPNLGILMGNMPQFEKIKRYDDLLPLTLKQLSDNKIIDIDEFAEADQAG